MYSTILLVVILLALKLLHLTLHFLSHQALSKALCCQRGPPPSEPQPGCLELTKPAESGVSMERKQ
jgi:hypothetical protein